MGIFDFIKKLTKNEPETEKVKYADLDKFILDKKNKNKEEEVEFITNVKRKVNELIKQLEERMVVLKTLDISNKKVEEKAKLIVKENLLHYINQLEKLIRDLRIIEDENANSIMKKLNQIFNNFEKRSFPSFQKATYIIGKELGETRDSIVNFSQEIKKITNSKKELIESSKTISLIENKQSELSEINTSKEGINEKIQALTNIIVNDKNKIKELESELDKIKDSNEYTDEIDKKKELDEKNQELERLLYNMKQMIDFKYLASIFHSNEKEMEIIKEHKDNFLISYKKDNGETILNLIRDTKMDLKEIEKKSEEINLLFKDLSSLEKNIPKSASDKILHNEKEIEGLKKQITSSTGELSREEKKYEKLEIKEREIFSDIKTELEKINIELE